MKKAITILFFLSLSNCGTDETKKCIIDMCNYMSNKMANCIQSRDNVIVNENLRNEMTNACVDAIEGMEQEATLEECEGSFVEVGKMSCGELLNVAGIE